MGPDRAARLAGSAEVSGELLDSIDVALKRLAGKHWSQVEATMTAQGFAPKDGGVLVLPKEQEATAPGCRPAWVRFSASTDKPVLVNPRALGLMP